MRQSSFKKSVWKVDVVSKATTGALGQTETWASLDWARANRQVQKLRQRIFRATQQREWKRVRDLQKLLLRSYSNYVLSVRQVNQGRNTPGVDGKLADTAQKRIRLVRRLQENPPHRPRLVRRVYIPKANGKQRPLGIPTIEDRVRQHVVKTALEPEWEARFEPTSYGFRPGRSTHDAIEHLFRLLRKGLPHQWVLDADIRGAFDHINHHYLLTQLEHFPGRQQVQEWLQAGYLEYGQLHRTEEGTPQGGIISPLLANIALDGLHQMLKGLRSTKGQQDRLGYVRYADDFVVVAPRRELLEQVKPLISAWLEERGLELNEEKTRLVHINQGFNFLGCNLRRYRGKLLVKPQKEKVLAKLKEVGQWLKAHKAIAQEKVIQHLNPILRGWANYYRHVVSKRVYSYMDHRLVQMLWRWAKRRHPSKGLGWVKARYFKQVGNQSWRFAAETEDRRGSKARVILYQMTDTPIIRHVMVRGGNSPDDPALGQYWAERHRRQGQVSYGKARGTQVIAARQGWQCPVCRTPLFKGEPIDMHHRRRMVEGGKDEAANLELRHEACHYNAHGRESKQLQGSSLSRMRR